MPLKNQPLRGRTLLDSSVLREQDSFGRANARPILDILLCLFALCANRDSLSCVRST